MNIKLKNREQRSRAEVLYCLDVLIRHLSDEDAIATWLAIGIPDGTLEKWPTDEQVEPFLDYANTEEFNELVFTALKIIKNETLTMKSSYVKGSLA